jgi:4-hydroxy-tetrahydrodipicolinate reductase
VMGMLSPEYKVSILETHHADKKDAPSGTAKMLANEVLQSGSVAAVPTYSLRGGSEVGEHRIIILGPGERLELSHRANDRSLFVHGALKLARGVLKLKPRAGGYVPSDLFLPKK